MVHFSINDKGVSVQKTLYPYSNLESFWIEEINNGKSRLILKSKKKLAPFISLPIKNVPEESIREHLLYYLPEEEHQEPLLIKIMEYLGF